MGPRASLDGRGKTRLHRDLIPEPSSTNRVALPTALSRPSPLRYPGPHHCAITVLTIAPPTSKIISFRCVVLAACTICSFLQAPSLRSPAGCMRFLFHTGNRTTGSCFLDLRQLQMKFLFVAVRQTELWYINKLHH